MLIVMTEQRVRTTYLMNGVYHVKKAMQNFDIADGVLKISGCEDEFDQVSWHFPWVEAGRYSHVAPARGWVPASDVNVMIVYRPHHHHHCCCY